MFKVTQCTRRALLSGWLLALEWLEIDQPESASVGSVSSSILLVIYTIALCF